MLLPAYVRRQLTQPPPGVFPEVGLDGLPRAVRRHLRAGITPGAPLGTWAALGRALPNVVEVVADVVIGHRA